MTAIAKTHTFTSGTKARASYVNTNFDDLVNALTLRNRDVKVGSLAVGTAATTGSMTITDNDGVQTYYISPVTSSVAITTNFDAGNQVVSITSHGITANQLLSFDTTTYLGNSVYVAKPYFAGNITTNTFKLYTEYSGTAYAAISAPDTATGHTLYKGGAIVTLPTLADNQGRRIDVYKNNAAVDLVCVVGENGEKMGGFKAISIFNQDTYLSLIAEATEWKVLNYPTKTFNHTIKLSGPMSTSYMTIMTNVIVQSKNMMKTATYFPLISKTGNNVTTAITLNNKNRPSNLVYNLQGHYFAWFGILNGAQHIMAKSIMGYSGGTVYQDYLHTNFSGTSGTVNLEPYVMPGYCNFFELTTAAGDLAI